MSDDNCGHVPALPDADPTICWKCGVIITVDWLTRLWRPVTAEEFPVLFYENGSGRWVIIHAVHGELAWSGASWVPHMEGFPPIRKPGEPPSVGICNFETREEAEAYAKEHFPAPVMEPPPAPSPSLPSGS